MTFAKSSVRLDSLFKKINKETGLIFSYNTRKIKPNITLDIIPGSYSLSEILLKIKQKTGLDYSLAENHIILKSTKSTTQISSPPIPALKENTKHAEVPTEAKKEKIQNSGFTTSPEPKKTTPDSSVEIRKSLPSEISTSNKSIDNSTTQSKTDSAKNSSAISPTIIKNESVTTELDSIKKTITKKPIENKVEPTPEKAKPSVKIKKQLQLMAGLSADETLYLGPSVQLGIPAIYGTASYKTDFSLGLFSYGLGTSFKLNNALRINIYATTGDLSRTFHVVSKAPGDTSTSLFDTIQVNSTIVVKSKLTRIGIVLEKKITSRMILQAGIQFNSLSTNYIVNGTPYSIGFTGSSADKTIYTVQPPYMLSNSYNSKSSSNVKTWIGLQVNILYILNFYKK